MQRSWIFLVLIGCGSPDDTSLSASGARSAPNGETAQPTTKASEVQLPVKARTQGVVFLHGTGDQAGDYACSGADATFHCEVKTAIDYWEQPTIDSERNGRAWAVLGCPLGSQTPWPNPKPVHGANEPGSAACAATQIDEFLAGPDGQNGTDDDIDDVVLISHSGGSNVIRYILEQRSANPTFARIHGSTRGFIALAPPTHGTCLANWAFGFATIPSILNPVIRLFGGEGFYDDDGTFFIQTDEMAKHNADPAKLVTIEKDIGGVPIFVGGGTFPDTDGDAAKVDCANGTETKALHVLHSLYLDKNDPDTFRDDCSDGFISCQSAMALAQGDASRVIFGRLDDGKVIGKTHFRAHNQSRRQCDGVDVDVKGFVEAIFANKQTFGLFRHAFVPAASQWRARLGATGARIVDATRDGDVVSIEVESDAPANLGVRATGVENELVVASDQTSRQVGAGRFIFAVSLPGTARIRDVALVRHDDASTLDIRDELLISRTQYVSAASAPMIAVAASR